MRPLLQFLRFILRLQGASVIGCKLLPKDGAVAIEIGRRRNAKPRCPVCRRVLSGHIVTRHREWRHLDLIRRKTYVVSDVREGYCTRHGRRVERVPWAAPGARHTHAFDLAVASLVQVADKSAAARMFDVSWPTVGRIVKRVVQARLSKDRLKGLEFIGVDETSFKRGHRYLTVVMDLMTGRVVWLGEGKSQATLASFFAELGEKRAQKIQAVAMDMSEAYRSAVEEHAKNASIIYDRFHVVKLLLDAVDEVRRDEVRQLSGASRKALKNTRYALFRNPKRYISAKDRIAIEQVQRTNRRLARVYELRCDFEDLWELRDPDEARTFLAKWTRAALRSRREPLRRFAQTVRKHIEGILGFFKFWGTTSGIVEGTNNKIKLAIHRAFGFHSVEALMAMVYLCCGGVELTL